MEATVYAHHPKALHDELIQSNSRDKNVEEDISIDIHFQLAIIFTCASLARNTVYTYLPLFLTERLQFAKVNTVLVSVHIIFLHNVWEGHLCQLNNQQLLGAHHKEPATTPYSCHSVFTDRSTFSLSLFRHQIHTGTSVTNCNHMHGLMSPCRKDVDMFT